VSAIEGKFISNVACAHRAGSRKTNPILLIPASGQDTSYSQWYE
jgi:hypothetical protein